MEKESERYANKRRKSMQPVSRPIFTGGTLVGKLKEDNVRQCEACGINYSCKNTYCSYHTSNKQY